MSGQQGHLGLPGATGNAGYLFSILRQTHPSGTPLSLGWAGSLRLPHTLSRWGAVHPSAPAGSIQSRGANRPLSDWPPRPFLLTVVTLLLTEGLTITPRRGRETDTLESPGASSVSPPGSAESAREKVFRLCRKSCPRGTGSPSLSLPPATPRHAEMRRRKASSAATSVGARLGWGAGLTLRARGRRRAGRWAGRSVAPVGLLGMLGWRCGGVWGVRWAGWESTSRPVGLVRVKSERPRLDPCWANSEIVQAQPASCLSFSLRGTLESR